MIGTAGLKNLQIDCVVGVYAFEREQQQRIVMDIELDYDITAAASTDEVNEAVDYDRVAEAVTDLVTRRAFHLLEAMAAETATMLLAEHASVLTVRLDIRKPDAVAAAECAFVRLERNRE